MADYNLTGKSGKIVCNDDDGSIVAINTTRKIIMVHFSGDEGPASNYKVTNKATDGDTYVSYIVKGPRGLSLTFSDRGDALVFNDTKEKLPLKCR